MANKKPLANYSGDVKELQSGDKIASTDIDVSVGGQLVSQAFNATTDWGSASGGYYSIAVTHNFNTDDVVHYVYRTTQAEFALAQDFIIEKTSANVSTLKISSSPDLRFAGKIIIISATPLTTGGEGVFEIDINGALQPSETVNQDAYYEADVNNDLMPKV